MVLASREKSVTPFSSWTQTSPSMMAESAGTDCASSQIGA